LALQPKKLNLKLSLRMKISFTYSQFLFKKPCCFKPLKSSDSKIFSKNCARAQNLQDWQFLQIPWISRLDFCSKNFCFLTAASIRSENLLSKPSSIEPHFEQIMKKQKPSSIRW
jgi:hypothetical protein